MHENTYVFILYALHYKNPSVIHSRLKKKQNGELPALSIKKKARTEVRTKSFRAVMVSPLARASYILGAYKYLPVFGSERRFCSRSYAGPRR